MTLIVLGLLYECDRLTKNAFQKELIDDLRRTVGHANDLALLQKTFDPTK